MSTTQRGKVQGEWRGSEDGSEQLMEEALEPSEVVTITGRFNWETGQYAEGRRIMRVREPLFRLGCLIVGLLLVMTALLVYYFTQGYDLFAEHWPQKLCLRRELARWLLLAGLLLSSHAAISALTRLLPILAFHMSKSMHREIPQRIALIGSFYVNIEPQIAWAIFMLVPYVATFWFFPQPALDSGQGHGPTIGELLQTIRSANLPNMYAQYPWQLFANHLLLALLIAAGLMVLQKALITKVAIHYHQKTLKKEIEDNRHALKVVKTLKLHLLHAEHVPHDQLGYRLFDRLLVDQKDDRETLAPADLGAHLAPGETIALFRVIDLDGNGDLTREEMHLAIKHLYHQRANLQKGIFDENEIIRGLNSLLHKVFLVVAVVIGLIVVDPSMETRLTTMGTTVMAATVLFHESAAIAFESIVFIVATHPFDVGDAVIVGDERFIVKECGLWMCTFVGMDGKTVYLTNHKMRSMYIANLKRSEPMDEDVDIKLHGSTTDEQLERLEAALKAFVDDHKRDYEAVKLKNIRILDKDRLNLTAELKHRSNFQSYALKCRRSRDFAYYLREVLQELGIQLAPPIPTPE